MTIDFKLKESINGVQYDLEIFSKDGEYFKTCENGRRYNEYFSKQDFLVDFPELEQWLWGRK